MVYEPMQRLLDIVRRLRSRQGCPWDREQTLASLKTCLVEETYEVLEAIDGGDRKALCEELGDLLLQVVLQAQICDEEGTFDFADVARTLADKLVRRHPHVFTDQPAAGPREALRNWNRIKKTEARGKAGGLEAGLSPSTPALLRAERIQKKAAQAGFDWDRAEPVWEKIGEELAEIKEALDHRDDTRIQEEVGDLLFSVVNLSRFLGFNAEESLRKASGKFVDRFRRMEERLLAQGRGLTDCSLDDMEAAWNRVKKEMA